MWKIEEWKWEGSKGEWEREARAGEEIEKGVNSRLNICKPIHSTNNSSRNRKKDNVKQNQSSIQKKAGCRNSKSKRRTFHPAEKLC